MFAIEKNSKQWALLITLIAFLIRLPYWEVIPASFDEVGQTTYALLIAQGRLFPLVANDAYAGPFYVYFLASLLRLGIDNPMIGRVVVMITGTLTIPVTYGWVQALSKNKVAGLIAALFVALNPDLILVNSHMGGATFLLPFFTTSFLLGITLAVRQDNVKWLIVAGGAAGIALQSNPVAGLLIAGGMLWLLWQTYHKMRLGKWWPFWPIFLAAIIVLIYTPVIVYNLTTDFQTVGVLQERSYLWQDNPTIVTTWNNLQRLSLQTVRQVSGVLSGDEQFAALVGIPLWYLVLMVAGLAYTSCRVSTLPIFVLVPFLIIFPIFSNHYGFISVGRFTTLLVPVWVAVIGILLATSIDKIRQMVGLKRKIYTTILFILTLLLLAYPVRSLFRYYQSVNASYESGRALLELSRYAAAHNQGEPIYISTIDELSFLRGVPYVPNATFLLGDIYHEFLPPQQIIGRLYENPGPAYFLLSDRNARLIQKVIPLERIAIPANEEAGMRNYGLYELETDAPLPKPDFVLSEKDIPDDLTPVVRIGGGVQLLGCDAPETDLANTSLSLNCYWQTINPMPPATYMGFAHLSDPKTSTLVAQDDHVLGQERYPLNAWRSDEVVKEHYTLGIPDNLTTGQYQLSIGIYTWPDLTRLSVVDSPDNVIMLPSVDLTGPR